MEKLQRIGLVETEEKFAGAKIGDYFVTITLSNKKALEIPVYPGYKYIGMSYDGNMPVTYLYYRQVNKELELNQIGFF